MIGQAQHMLQSRLAGFLRSHGPDWYLREVATQLRMDQAQLICDLSFRAFKDDQPEHNIRFVINDVVLGAVATTRATSSRNSALFNNVNSMWSRMAEDFRMRERARLQREAYRTLSQVLPSPEIEAMAGEIDALQRHVAEFHSRYTIAVDLAGGPDVTAMTAVEVQRRSENARRRLDERVRETLDEHMTRMAERVITSTVAEPAAASSFSIENIRAALQTMLENPPPRRDDSWLRDLYRLGRPSDAVRRRYLRGEWLDDLGTPEARAKGKALLLANLTPEQREEYEKNKHFHVVGGATGRTYRIREGRQMNIDVLNGDGSKAHGLCFLPEGQLVAGDVMLAQKIALECMEESALAVANKF